MVFSATTLPAADGLGICLLLTTKIAVMTTLTVTHVIGVNAVRILIA